MAIQFMCPACSQPIEVDDQWSARPVACPYCRKTVTAPEVSTLDPPSIAPQASPIGLPPEASVVPSPAEYAAPTPHGNPVAFWALGLAVASLILNVVFRATVVPRIFELAGPDASPQEAQQVILDQMAGGAVPGWLLVGSLAFMAACAAWAAGLVCGIIAVTRPGRRRMAVGSLALCGLTLVLCCL